MPTLLDAESAVHRWFSAQSPRWRSLSVEATLRLPEGTSVNKAVVTLETPRHVASITVWGEGTLEFIVLDLATRRERVLRDGVFATTEDLSRLLAECAESFDRLGGSS